MYINVSSSFHIVECLRSTLTANVPSTIQEKGKSSTRSSRLFFFAFCYCHRWKKWIFLDFFSVFKLFVFCQSNCWRNRKNRKRKKHSSVCWREASSHILKSTIVETKIKKWIFHEDKRAENSIKFFSPHLVCLLDFFDSKKERSGKMKKRQNTKLFW